MRMAEEDRHRSPMETSTHPTDADVFVVERAEVGGNTSCSWDLPGVARTVKRRIEGVPVPDVVHDAVVDTVHRHTRLRRGPG
jgi:hypothetical protein